MPPFDHPVPLALSEALLDFRSPGFEPATALAQLQGSTALYNILAEQGLAYLADEVGMGKTYQAFGVLSLLWHHEPDASVLVIAPTQTVQDKWLADYQSFVERNVRVRDDRIRDGLTGGPIHPARKAHNLVDLVHKRFAEPAALIVARMSSFSAIGRTLGFDSETATAAEVVEALHRRQLFVPSDMPDETYVGSTAICTAAARMIAGVLPPFDLVVVDEAQALRNRGQNIRTNVFAALLGLRPPGVDGRVSAPTGAPRMLLMSATPAYRAEADIYNQLAFRRHDADEPPAEIEARDEYLRQFFVRRLRLFHGKNKYDYREPLAKARTLGTEHAVEELFLALVQKKLEAALDQQKRFGTALKIGFLETFESYKPSIEFDTKPETEDEDADDSSKDFDEEPAAAPDTEPLRELVRDYRAALGDEQLPPHPKQMMIEELAEASFRSTAPVKALIFVRRLASVRELARRISSAYDRVVLERLSLLLNERFDRPEDFLRYVDVMLSSQPDDDLGDDDDSATGSEAESRSLILDIFVSRPRDAQHGGHRFRQRLNADRPLASVFEENLTRFWFESSACCAEHEFEEFARAHLYGAVTDAASVLETSGEYFRQKTFRRTRGHWLVQHAALRGAAAFARRAGDAKSATLAEQLAGIVSLLGAEAKRSPGLEPSAQNLERCWSLLLDRSFWDFVRAEPTSSELATFLTTGWMGDETHVADALRRREALRNVIDKNIRMGEGILAIFVAYAKAFESDPDARFVDATAVAAELCGIFHGDTVDGQRLRYRVAQYFPIADQLSKYLYGGGRRRSQPTFLDTKLSEFNDRAPVSMVMGGSSSRRQTIVQFNSPFIPDFVVSTNVLQEGVDLHLSCNSVWHYGLASTPGSIEQRVGRVDRYYSMAHRALAPGVETPAERTLNVVFPYLARSVDEQQLGRTLSRIRAVQPLMDRGLQASASEIFDIDDSLQVTVQTILKDIQGIGEDVPAAPFEPERHYDETGDFTVPRDTVTDPERYLEGLRRSLQRTFKRLSPPELARCAVRTEQTPNAIWLVWGNIPLSVVGEVSELARRHEPYVGMPRDQPIAVQLVFSPSLRQRLLRLETPLGSYDERLEPPLRKELFEREAHLRGFRLRIDEGNETKWGFALVHDFPDPESPVLANTVEHFARMADEIERTIFDDDIPYEHDPGR